MIQPGADLTTERACDDGSALPQWSSRQVCEDSNQDALRISSQQACGETSFFTPIVGRQGRFFLLF